MKNDSGRPITVWLVKEGPPVEEGWRSPEQLAISVPGHEERIGGRVVPAGKIADTGLIAGEFAEGSYAFLRIYDGEHRLSEILAMSRGDRSRLDLPLDVGVNCFVVKDQSGTLAAVPVRQLPTTAPSPATAR